MSKARRDNALPRPAKPRSKLLRGRKSAWYLAGVDAAPVTVTDRAAKKALELAAREGVAKQLRLGVRGGGCSGLSYFFEFEKPPKVGETVWHVLDLEICIDVKSQKILAGCVLDFEDTGLLKRGFRFSNPNAKQSCSCGDSFTL